MSPRKERPGRSTAARSHDISDEDTRLFRRAVRDVRPLDTEIPDPVPVRAAPKARFARRDERDVLIESLAPDIDQSEAGSGDALKFQRPTVGRRTMRKLCRGGYSVQAEIDLHGMTVAEANTALRQFIEESIRRRHTCVRIVHGKGRGSGGGGPVLKRKVDAWLRRWSPVLAYVSARQVDGGTGAVYVLLDAK